MHSVADKQTDGDVRERRKGVWLRVSQARAFQAHAAARYRQSPGAGAGAGVGAGARAHTLALPTFMAAIKSRSNEDSLINPPMET